MEVLPPKCGLTYGLHSTVSQKMGTFVAKNVLKIGCHHEERCVRPAMTCPICWSNDLWKMSHHNFRTLFGISTNFTQCSLLFDLRLCYHKICARRFQKKAEKGFRSDFLEAIPRSWQVTYSATSTAKTRDFLPTQPSEQVRVGLLHNGSQSVGGR